MTHTDAELAEGLRTGTLRCLHCGEQRPVDSWCTCPADQANADRADQAARAAARRHTDVLIREHDRQSAERRRELLAAGRWTPAGGDLEVRWA